MTQLQRLLIAAPGLAMLLLAPGLIGLHPDLFTAVLSPTALVYRAESVNAGMYERYNVSSPSVRPASGGSIESLIAPLATAYTAVSNLPIAHISLVDISPSRAP